MKALGAPWGPDGRSRRPPVVWIAGAILFLASFAAGLSLVHNLARQAGGGGPGVVSPAERPTGEPALIQQIKQQVAEIRGLQWKRPLPVHVVPRPELARELHEANSRDPDPEPAIPDEALLKLLGLIPQDADYQRILDGLSRAEVVGFYEPDRKEIFVAEIEGGIDPRTMMTIAHELDHALVDQHFGFGARLKELGREGRDEEAAAFRALIEGDARQLEYTWADRHLTQEEQIVAILGGGEEGNDAELTTERPPRFLLDASSFPYDAGQHFVEALYKQDGWAGINHAYQELPRSTSEVLHPELYPSPAPQPPAQPRVRQSSGCRVERTGVLGEFDMTEVLELQPSAAAAEQAVAGWRGDTFAAARCGTSLGLVLRWRSADPPGAQRLAAALATWAKGWSQSLAGVGPDGRFAGRAGAGRLTREGDVVHLLISRDATTTNRLGAALSD